MEASRVAICATVEGDCEDCDKFLALSLLSVHSSGEQSIKGKLRSTYSNKAKRKRQMKFNAREKLPPPFGLMEQSVRKSSHFSFPFPIHRRKSSPSELHFERLESILRGKSNKGIVEGLGENTFYV